MKFSKKFRFVTILAILLTIVCTSLGADDTPSGANQTKAVEVVLDTVVFNETQKEFAVLMDWNITDNKGNDAAEKFAALNSFLDMHGDERFVNMPKYAPRGIMAGVVNSVTSNSQSITDGNSGYAAFSMKNFLLTLAPEDSVAKDINYYMQHLDKMPNEFLKYHEENGRLTFWNAILGSVGTDPTLQPSNDPDTNPDMSGIVTP
jgi:hypothetical protein